MLITVLAAPPKTVKRRKDGHVPGEEDEGDIIALSRPVVQETPVLPLTPSKDSLNKVHRTDDDSATEEEFDEDPVKKPELPLSPPMTDA